MTTPRIPAPGAAAQTTSRRGAARPARRRGRTIEWIAIAAAYAVIGGFIAMPSGQSGGGETAVARSAHLLHLTPATGSTSRPQGFAGAWLGRAGGG
jgi:hypothetical protein